MTQRRCFFELTNFPSRVGNVIGGNYTAISAYHP